MEAFKKLALSRHFSRRDHVKRKRKGSRMLPELKKILFPVFCGDLSPQRVYIDKVLSVKKFTYILSKSIEKNGPLSTIKCETLLEISYMHCSIPVYLTILKYMLGMDHTVSEKYFVNLVKLCFHSKNTHKNDVLEIISIIPENMFGDNLYAALLDLYFRLEYYVKTNEIIRIILEKRFGVRVSVCVDIILKCAQLKEITQCINIERVLNILMILDPTKIGNMRDEIVDLCSLELANKRISISELYESDEYILKVIEICRETNDLVTEQYIHYHINSYREMQKSLDKKRRYRKRAENGISEDTEKRRKKMEYEMTDADGEKRPNKNPETRKKDKRKRTEPVSFDEKEQSSAKEFSIEKEIEEYIHSAKMDGKDTPTIFAEGVEYFTRNGRFDLLANFGAACQNII